MSICADPNSFTTDERGVLRVRIAGDPDPVEWPYSCQITESNLHRDGDCLWVDPLPHNALSAVTGTFFPNVQLTGTPITLTGVCSLTVTNPDPCRVADAFFSVTTDWAVESDFGAGTYGVYIFEQNMYGTGIFPGEGMVQVYKNHIGGDGASVRIRQACAAIDIPPLGTATITLDMKASRAQSSLIWTRAAGWITGYVTSQ